MKLVIWLALLCAAFGAVGSAFAELSASGSQSVVYAIEASLFLICFTVAAGAIAIVGAVERIGQPKAAADLSGVPEEI